MLQKLYFYLGSVYEKKKKSLPEGRLFMTAVDARLPVAVAVVGHKLLAKQRGINAEQP